ncbi:MAG: hypothetical protein LQ341_007614 [Variospora aurantia]|nr:MAG: hypothetical protein LQ341_007614 [Variospora aurantia]
MTVRVDPTGTYGQTVWIEASSKSSIGSMDLPYVGCVTALADLPVNSMESGQDDNSDRMRTLDEDYVNALINRARQVRPGRYERSDTPHERHLLALGANPRCA